MMSSGNANSYIAFATTPTNNTSATERVRIDKDGNVGIGDSNPGARLEITPSGTDAVYINNSGGTLKYDLMTYGLFRTIE